MVAWCKEASGKVQAVAEKRKISEIVGRYMTLKKAITEE